FRSVLRLKDSGRFLELRLLLCFLFLQRLDVFQRHLQPELKFRLERSSIILSQQAAIEELALVDLGDRWPLIDLRIEIRLSEPGIINFLVAVFAIAIHVDDKIAPEFLSEINRHLRNKLERNWVLA